MRYIFFIIFSFILALSCSNKKEEDKFLVSLDSLLKNYKYSEVVNIASNKLRTEGTVLDSNFKADIYWRYALAVSMKNRGAVHFTILDSLKRYGVDTLFFRKRDEIIQKVQKEFKMIRDNLGNNNVKENIEALDKILLEYPTFDKAKHLKDSLEKSIKNSDD